VPGVRKVVGVPTGVAVIADHFWAAKLGRDALEVDWDPGPGGEFSTDGYLAELRALVDNPVRRSRITAPPRRRSPVRRVGRRPVRAARTWRTRRWSRSTRR